MLTCTFQSDFEALMKIPHTFGELLGSASRMFKALAQVHSSFPNRIKLACSSYVDATHGPGLVTNMTKWFPELKPLKKHMHTGSRYDLKNARKTYEFCISKIRVHCGCPTCEYTSTGVESTDKETDISSRPSQTPKSTEDEPLNDSGSDQPSEADFEIGWDPDQYCQVVIAETIFTFPECSVQSI